MAIGGQSGRRGAVAVLVAICLTAMMSVVAIAVDGGLLLGEKRQAQATADAAALAGAADLFKNWPKYEGSDDHGTAKASALAIAASNGYSNDGTTSTVDIRTAGQTYLGGPNAGQPIFPGYIDATVTYNQRRYFSAIFGSGTIPVKARAVAHGSWRIPKYGIIVLDPRARSALSLNGNGIISVPEGTVMVNSSHDSAVVNTNNGVLTAAEVDINGGNTGGGTYITSPVPDNINYDVPPASDPYASLPPPSVPPAALKPQRVSPKDPSVTDLITDLLNLGQLSPTSLADVKNVYLLEPGYYGSTNNKLPNFSNGELVIFKQASAGNGGIYYLDDGLTANTANLLMDPTTSGGIMFYNVGAQQSDSISIAGGADSSVYLSALEDGSYKGLLIYQNRQATAPISITGNGDFTMIGGMYAANAEVRLTGNGAAQTIGSQIIARYVTAAGNGNINVAYNSGLVPPQRRFHLVE